MMIKRTILSFIFFIFSCEVFSSDDELKLKFFNVGQGNCTLVTLPKGTPLLVDAGTSSYPISPKGGKDSVRQISRNLLQRIIVQDIVQDIEKSLPKLGNPIDLQVIISHSDRDHFNLVSSILKSFKEKKVTFLLGESEENYKKQSKEGEEFQNSLRNPSYSHSYVYTGETPSCLEVLQGVIQYGEATGEILSASGKTTNDKSIILRIKYGDFSFILTGDGEGESTDNILRTKKFNLTCIESTILQMSHHGAITRGSNNIAWIQNINPQFAVFSAGLHVGHGHPQGALKNDLSLFSNNLRKNVSDHNVTTYGGKIANGDTSIANHSRKGKKEKKIFEVHKTNKGYYCTHDSGHITFKWKKDATFLDEPSCSYDQNPSTSGNTSATTSPNTEGEEEEGNSNQQQMEDSDGHSSENDSSDTEGEEEEGNSNQQQMEDSDGHSSENDSFDTEGEEEEEDGHALKADNSNTKGKEKEGS